MRVSRFLRVRGDTVLVVCDPASLVKRFAAFRLIVVLWPLRFDMFSDIIPLKRSEKRSFEESGTA